MKLHELKPNSSSNKARKRVGRGTSSGHGKTSGKGHKGQNARSGPKRNPMFEGGQTPLFKRLPKRGFTSLNKIDYGCVNLSSLNAFPEGSVVDLASLKAAGLVAKKHSRLKILGDGALEVKLTVKADKFSTTALDAITKIGGTAEVI